MTRIAGITFPVPGDWDVVPADKGLPPKLG